MWSSLAAHPRRGLQVVGLALLTLGLGAFATPALGRMAERGVGIIDVELMHTTLQAELILARLGPSGVESAQTSVYLDFPFLILYAATLSAACVLVAARGAQRGSALFDGLGRSMAWVAVVAAACDAVENVAVLVVLDGDTAQPWPALAFWFASVKFALLAVTVLFVLIGLVVTRRTA